MKVNAAYGMQAFSNPALNTRRLGKAGAVSSVTNNSYANALPYASLSFGGAKNKMDVAFVMAEFPDYAQVGGVSTVAKDYLQFPTLYENSLKAAGLPTEGVHAEFFMPYYNGEIQYDPKTGLPTGKVNVRMIDGKPVYIKSNVMASTSMEDIVAKRLYSELEAVDSKTMQWGLNSELPITLYKVKEPNLGVKNADLYMVFNNDTASMPKPYAGNIAYSSSARTVSKGFEGTPYGQFSKAFTKLLPGLEKAGISPETIICSDAQTAFVPEFAVQEQLKGAEYYKDLKATFVGHNLGMGYNGECSAKAMFSNLATKEQIEAVLSDPKYFEALKNGTEDAYFRPFVQQALDATGTANPNMIPLRHLQNGFVTAVDTVSEGYAESIAKNPSVSPGLHPLWRDLYAEGKVGGILNGFDNQGVSAFKPLSLPGYSQVQKCKDINGIERVFEPFEVFAPKDKITFESMLNTRRHNKINLFSRLSGEIADNTVLTGNPARSCKLMGFIDQNYVQMLKDGKNVPTFVEWGRGDFQKGFVTAMDAFEKFAALPEGKDSVLILGAGLTRGEPETERILKRFNELLAKPELKGRVAFFDGFAPSYALAASSEALLVPSNSAPCELVDLEGAKYFSTPITTNIQGLAQKNFDISIPAEAAKANAYKTMHGYDMGDDLIDLITRAYTQNDDALLGEVKKEFPQVQESVFKQYAEKYQKLMEGFRKQFTGKADAEYVDDLAKKAMQASDEHSGLVRSLKEGILSDELCHAMTRRVQNLDNEVAQTIFKNQLEMDTTWAGNNALHPSGHSSWELYKLRHIDPAPGKAVGSVLDFDDSLLGLAGKAANGAKADGAAGLSFLGRAKKYLGDKRIQAALAGAAALLAIAGGVFFTHNKKKANAAKAQAETVFTPNNAYNAVPNVQNSPVSTPQTPTYSAPSGANLSQNKFASVFGVVQST